MNATRRAFQSALRELERLDARDRDVVFVTADAPSADAPVTNSPESKLQTLGSLRQNDAA